MMTQILASTPPLEVMTFLMPILGWVTTFVVAVIGAVMIRNTRTASRAEGKAEGKAEAMMIGPQPFMVELKDKFVRREEFAEFKGEVKADVREMRGLFDKAVTLIAERDERLTENINSVASGAYEGRRRLHEKVNEHSAKLERLSVNSEVSRSIGKLGAAIVTLAKASPSSTQKPD